jgi:hypothetical protein
VEKETLDLDIDDGDHLDELEENTLWKVFDFITSSASRIVTIKKRSKCQTETVSD